MLEKNDAPRAGSVLTVRFFGRFEFSVNGNPVRDLEAHNRPWTLLQYLVINRHAVLSRRQLIDAIWPDGGSAQPEKALKNLVYRIRTTLEKLGVPGARDLVISSSAGYRLNNTLHWDIDAERLEQLYKMSSWAGADEEDVLQWLTEAVDLYRGDFLEEAYEEWMSPYQQHYRTVYVKCVEKLLPLLEKREEYHRIEAVTEKALEVDRFQESLHLAYMSALICQGETAAAAAHYIRTADIFFHELNVMPGDPLRGLYSTLNGSYGLMQPDLDTIRNLLEEEQPGNKFICDFDTFRSVYRLQRRMARRTGHSQPIALFTLHDGHGQRLALEGLDKNMKALQEAICLSLRNYDIVTRFSSAQYLLMLPDAAAESMHKVVQRITGNFQQMAPGAHLDVTVGKPPAALADRLKSS